MLLAFDELAHVLSDTERLVHMRSAPEKADLMPSASEKLEHEPLALENPAHMPVPHDEPAHSLLAIEHPLMRAPFEGVNNCFRNGQKLLDREMETVLKVHAWLGLIQSVR